jgi:hypothetical protein
MWNYRSDPLQESYLLLIVQFTESPVVFFHTALRNLWFTTWHMIYASRVTISTDHMYSSRHWRRHTASGTHKNRTFSYWILKLKKPMARSSLPCCISSQTGLSPFWSREGTNWTFPVSDVTCAFPCRPGATIHDCFIAADMSPPFNDYLRYQPCLKPTTDIVIFTCR